MRITSITVVLLLVANINLLGQNKQGNAIYQFKTSKDNKRMQLSFNDSASLFIYYKTGLDTGSTTRTSFYADYSKGAVIHSSSYDSVGKIVYRDFSHKSIVIRETWQPPFEPFTIKDDWVNIAWKIKDEYKNVSGFKCRKATGSFRGRDYTAWFAPEIPVPYGPWKLFGLPGLIVAAYDKKRYLT